MKSTTQKYIFYRGDSDNIKLFDTSLPDGYSFSLWRPALNRITPKGLFRRTFIFCWIFHILRLFKSSNYSIFIIYYDQKIVHYSVVMPPFFKYPFMNKNDIQIGPIDTESDHRRKGLSSYTIGKIIDTYLQLDTQFWYIVRDENEISKRVIEKYGFTAWGEGSNRKILSIPGTGIYKTEKHY